MAASRADLDAERMLRDVWVVFDHGPRARWALECAAALATHLQGRLTLVHFVAPAELDGVDDSHRDLSGVGEAARLRGYLHTLVAAIAGHVEFRVRVFAGHAAPQLRDLLHWERPELVVASARGGSTVAQMLFPDAGGVLLWRAPCPVLLVRSDPPPAGSGPEILVCTARQRRAAAAEAEELAAPFGWRSASTVPLRTRRSVAAVAADCRERRPRFVLVERGRFAGFLGALMACRLDALLDAGPCPVLVVPHRPAHRGSRTKPMVSSVPFGPPSMASSHLLTDTQPAAGTKADDGTPAVRRRMSLLWKVFAANALVLLAATLVLIVAPVSVSSRPVLAEAVVLTVGLLVMLAIHLLLLHRTLAPLRLLTDVMGAIDPHHPGRRLQVDRTAAAEVGALSGAFNAMLDRLEDERRTSARRALTAQEDERLRIAREMHDEVGQTLTALTIQAERAAEMADPIDRALLRQIAQTALQGLDDVRRIGRELRPEALDDLGLGNALITLCRRMSAQSGVRVAPRLEPGPALRPEVELALYRVAQEAVTNALRHADAARVDVSLQGGGDAVRLLVSDDGRGMPATVADDTAGLAGMRERALLVGGSLSLHSRPGEGTEVRLAVPLEEAAAR